MQACKYCYAINVTLVQGVCNSCQLAIDEARPTEEKELELWQS